jgi:hypothetical protein
MTNLGREAISISNMKRKILILCLILLISSYFTISVYSSANDSVLWLDRASYSGYGVRPIITLQNDDLNINPKRRDQVNVTVCSTADTAGITVNLMETLSDSGEFTANFGVCSTKSDDVLNMLQVVNNDTITVTLKETNPISGSVSTYTLSAGWKASTGTAKFNKSDYKGLTTIATVSVSDKDLDMRSAFIDTARIRIYSDADPIGITLTAYETGINTGNFAANFRFSIIKSDIGDAVIKVNPSDKIYATYFDEMAENGAVNVPVTVTTSFQFSEAIIKTSVTNDEGSGNMFTVTIDEPDANNPKVKDRLIAKANSSDGTQEKTIWLDETGINSGSFKGTLYFNEEMTTANSLRVKSTDVINIKYKDNTIPQGGTTEVVKAVKWTYIGTLLKTDKEVYTGYGGSAKITLSDYNLNFDEEKAEYLDVRVTTSDSKGIKLELKETGSSSGEFTGTLRFGKSSKASEGIIKVANNEIITITYTNPKDKDDTTECYAKWSFQDGQLTLDRQDYKGNDAQVKVTLKDLDASDDVKKQDDIRVVVKALGSGKESKITLTETSKNSGTYTGTFYIHGSGNNRPSVSLSAAEKFEVIYTDEYNTTGKNVDRIASAVWGGVSTATLTLDKQNYIGYGSQMVIVLVDADQNKSLTGRDKVSVQVRTKSGKTNMTYTLTETGSNSGEFSVVLDFAEGTATSNKVRVIPDDMIYVDFIAKGVSAYAKFTKQ